MQVALHASGSSCKWLFIHRKLGGTRMSGKHGSQFSRNVTGGMPRTVCFIVPAVLLEQVIRRGSGDELASALDTRLVDNSLPPSRIQASLHGQAAAPLHHALGATPQRTINDAQSQQDENPTLALR